MNYIVDANPIIDEFKDKKIKKGVEIVISNLVRLYEPSEEKEMAKPMEFYCVRVFYRNGQKSNIMIEVKNEKVSFVEAYETLLDYIEEAREDGFNIRYSGDKTAKEDIAGRLDSDVLRLKCSERHYQSKLDILDTQNVRAILEQESLK